MREPADDFTPIEEKLVEFLYVGDQFKTESIIRTADIIVKWQRRGVSLDEQVRR